MNEEVEKRVNAMPYKDLDVLEVSGSEWQDFGFKSYQNVNYPDYDICESTTGKTYDMVIVEQVFEHIENPQAAAKNIYKMLRKDGTLLITTPFMIKYHPSPLDLWRWSKDGLRIFLEQNGFDNVETFAWGNKECVVGNLETWPIYDKKKHSLVNDEEYPLVVWGFAKRTKQNLRKLIVTA